MNERDATAAPPLLKGGQGRDESETRSSAMGCLALLVWGVVVVLSAIAAKSLREGV